MVSYFLLGHRTQLNSNDTGVIVLVNIKYTTNTVQLWYKYSGIDDNIVTSN